MVIEIIQREIPAKGIGYLILRDCPEDRLKEGLKKGMERLKKAGAKTVWATSLPEGEPLYPGPLDIWRLTHVHDIVRMERSLPGEKPEIKLNLRSPKKAQEEGLYLSLVNRAFTNVPNAATQRPTDLRKQNHRYTIAYQGDKAVGAFEVDLTEKTPELVTLAVEPELWRQGLGRSILRSALESMGKASDCSLVVSSANPAAMALYESEGFVQAGVVSSWFEVV